MRRSRFAFALPILSMLACGRGSDAPAATSDDAPRAPSADTQAPLGGHESAPLGQLPKDVKPVASSLELTIDPAKERFSGVAEITVDLTRARSTIWLHGRNLAIKRATVTAKGGVAMAATWEDAHESGVAALRLARPLGPGRVTLRFEYDAPFGGGMHGLYRFTEAGVPYAITQFEAIAAREAFPSFDEPAFKIPFSVTLVVPNGQKAFANTREVAREDVAGMTRIRFAETLPLPSYLVAFAVGPYDVVDARPVPPNDVRKRPLPLRGIAAKGRGKELAYALAHTGAILSTLEAYTGVEYPYDKLDIVADPDKEGAMENPGLVTFREFLVLRDETTAPVRQKRAFASVMAHELAHQWFGDLVTNAWWDDIWLNEAFATWMGHRTHAAWDPESHADLDFLDGVQAAMSTDALVAARRIRQPIVDKHDISNAFDAITYQKGGGVLAMVEHWIGPERFQKGIHGYLEKHRFGVATADDLMASLSEAAGKDVGTPFKTFLDQPGVPFVETALACDGAPRLTLKQSRFFPLGSSGSPEQAWQIPFCARYEAKGEPKLGCTLLTSREATLPLDGASCPAWVMPNADAAGYFRFSMAPAELTKLRDAGGKLTTREKMAWALAVRASFTRGTTTGKGALEAMRSLVTEERASLANQAEGYLETARNWLEADPKLRAATESYARSLYGPVAKQLGWDAPKGQIESSETTLKRQDVLGFLALTAKDPALRKELAKRGRAYIGVGEGGKLHPEAVDPNLASIALSVAAEEADAKLFDAMLALLEKTTDDIPRGQLVTALGSVLDPELAKRARELAFDPRLKAPEVLGPVQAQLARLETREAAWAWVKANFDKLAEKLGPRRAARLAGTPVRFCDDAHTKDAETFFAGRFDALDGGPRVLATVLEEMHLCVARRTVQEPSFRAMFATPPKR